MCVCLGALFVGQRGHLYPGNGIFFGDYRKVWSYSKVVHLCVRASVCSYVYVCICILKECVHTCTLYVVYGVCCMMYMVYGICCCSVCVVCMFVCACK